MENNNGSISFVLKFQEVPLLQEVKVIDFLNIPLSISKPQVINGATYNSEMPIGLISNFTTFRDGMAFNANVWLQFLEDINLENYKAQCEFKVADGVEIFETKLSSIILVQAKKEEQTSEINSSNEVVETNDKVLPSKSKKACSK